jgi:hypothetical protein
MIGLACFGIVSPVFGGITGNLGLYSNTGNVATFDYRVTFDQAGSFDAFSVDVAFSGVAGQQLTNFGAFSFDTTVGDFAIDPPASDDSPAFPAWDHERTFSDADLSDAASSIYRRSAPSGTSENVMAGTYLIGRLKFDYAAIDFPVGEPREFTVNVTGQSIMGTPQTSFLFLPAVGEGEGGIISPGSTATWTQVVFGEGEGQTGNVTVSIPSNVPEPGALAIWGLLGFAAIGFRRRVKR